MVWNKGTTYLTKGKDGPLFDKESTFERDDKLWESPEQHPSIDMGINPAIVVKWKILDFQVNVPTQSHIPKTAVANCFENQEP